ncbi:MAG: DEAD/DEAH box helicase [Actinomycetota bacterium]
MSPEPPSDPEADLGFDQLGLPRALVDALRRQGIERPFEVQAATIPDALAGRDVLGRAPTGSGKTLAFGLPLLAEVEASDDRRRPRGLILAPTRELAEQIRRELEPLAATVDRKVAVVYGGVAQGPQVKALRGADVVVATPGRLQDLLDQGELSLDRVDRVVVDEADRMADMGFLPAVRQLLDLTSTKRQTILFSATLDNDVAVLIKQYQNDPARHEIGEVEPDLSRVTHRFIATTKDSKLSLTAQLVEDSGPTMVFCRTRHGVDRVARQLKRSGVKAGWIHGGRTQRQRDAALDAFTTGKVAALVATDVAARGIHVDGVACVIHYDPPADHKDYVHRSGRTARAGTGGVVVSLVNNDQRKAVTRLKKQVGLPPADLEDSPELRPRPTVEWVDQRPDGKRRGRKTKRGAEGEGDGTTSTRRHDQRNGDDKPRNRNSDAKPRNRNNDRNSDAKPRNRNNDRNSDAKPRNRNKGRNGEERRRSGDHDATDGGRSSGERRRNDNGERRSRPSRDTDARPRAGTGSRSEAGAGGKGRRSKAKAKAGTGAKRSKRSGRPRAKDHKQKRR